MQIIVHKRKYRILSFILVAALLLTGAYLNTAAEDIFFCHGCTENSAIHSSVFQTDINDVAACMTETLNECSSMEQQSIKLDPLLCLLCSNHISLFAGKLSGGLTAAQSLRRLPDGLVIDFMHQSDGKKRN